MNGDLLHYLAEDGRRWLRPLLVAGPLLLAALFAAGAPLRELTLLAAAAAALCAFLVFLRWPPLGLITAAVAGLFVPFYGPGGLNVTALLIAALLGLWLLQMIAGQREIRFVRSRTTWPMLALIAMALVSFGFGQFRWFAFAGNTPLDAQLGGLAIVVLSAVAFLLVANQIQDLTWLRRLTWIFLAFAALSFTGRTVLPLLGLPTRHLFQNVGSLFYVWFIAIAFSQAVFNRDLHRGWRIGLAASVLLTVFILAYFKFGDKSGWLPAIATIVAIVVFHSRWVGVALILTGTLSSIFLVPQLLATDSYSIYTRFEAWAILAQIVEVSPIWGLGFANYYSYTTLFPIRGYAVSFNSHNNFVDIIAQMGLVGLACLAWFFLEAGALGWRLRDKAPEGFARSYVYGAMGGLAGSVFAGMLGDWLLPFVYNIGLAGLSASILAWIFLGGLVSLEQIVMREI